MARPLRIEYPGAIHHVMSRGNLRRSAFEDERDYQRLLQGLEQTVRRFGWDLPSFVLISTVRREGTGGTGGHGDLNREDRKHRPGWTVARSMYTYLYSLR